MKPVFKDPVKHLGPLLALFILCLGLCKSRELRPIADFADRRHIGHWLGRDSSRSGKIILYANGFAFFSAMGRSFGGPKLSPRGALLYQIDYDSNPIQLDLIGVNAQYQELRRIKMIIEFLSARQIRVCTYMTDTRPQNFDSAQPCRTIVLHKKK